MHRLYPTAVHEAAHAVLAYRTGMAWMMPDAELVVAEDGSGSADIRSFIFDPRSDAIMTFAGNYAAKLYCGVEYVSRGDAEALLKLGKENGGLDKLEEWSRETVEILREPSTEAAVRRLADELIKRRKMTGAEVVRVIQPWLKGWNHFLYKPEKKDLHRFPDVLRSHSGVQTKADVPAKATDQKASHRRAPRDYKNVRIAGYLSTFKHVTPSDRDGDAIERGAFRDSISDFMRKNPVLLASHENLCERVCGTFTALREDDRGLYCEAAIANGLSQLLIQVRAMIVEGHLKAFSVGGHFFYGSDGRTVKKVEIFEGSLVSIPSNPEALFKCIHFEPIT